ncbi:MAG: hypothetical protein CLLPBCKN_008617 [Chroococcidiopsis cubana SAG 39.79]|uniref:hypothetical protein n=1 Tax=Chroococcidiopsis cubana TaxID=171392 RepID=UPI0013158A2A|nr:hypothetical protein [Chroococcidiopsis cubana]MDZ4879179.1 hypothetical protein [Chroococcidiopsis cubana SAG 39.79]
MCTYYTIFGYRHRCAKIVAFALRGINSIPSSSVLVGGDYWEKEYASCHRSHRQT